MSLVGSHFLEAEAQPEGKMLVVAVKAIDKVVVAAEVRNDGLVRALEASRAPLSEQVAMGIRPPDAKAPRGRRRKGEAA